MKRFLAASLFLSLLFINGQKLAFSDVVSLQSNYVAGESSVVNHLNDDRTKLANGVNNVQGVYTGSVQSSGQVKAKTIGEENMADDANPRIRTYEGASCAFVYSGLLPSTTVGTLTGSIPAGTAYPVGYRIDKSNSTGHTFTASKWTWIDLDKNGSFNYIEQPIGTATPAVTVNSIRLAKVSTDSTQILSVTDLRKTSCTNGPFSSISDAAGEASLGDVLQNASGGILNGLRVTSNDTNSVKVGPGSVYINGFYRSSNAETTVPINVNGSSLTGVPGLDTGSAQAGKTYYIYATADQTGTKNFTPILSLSSSGPTGPLNYRRIGEVSTDGAAVFSAPNPITISGSGKIVQIKTVEFNDYKTGNAVIPNDDTIPQITEGTEFMAIDFTPVNAKNKLKIDVTATYAANISRGYACALFKTTDPNAIAAVTTTVANADYGNTVSFSKTILAGQTSKITFTVRMGDGSGQTIYFNGISTGRYYGGKSASSITITEYEG